MMKKITTAALIAIIALSWVSCKKKTNSTTPDPVIARGITAKINGVPWTAAYVSYISSTGLGADYIDFDGYDTSGKGLKLRIVNFRARGTYNIPQANDSAFYDVDYGSFANPIAATTGQVVIQAVNDTAVGGTFHFTAGTMVVTEGTFNVNY